MDSLVALLSASKGRPAPRAPGDVDGEGDGASATCMSEPPVLAHSASIDAERSDLQLSEWSASSRDEDAQVAAEQVEVLIDDKVFRAQQSLPANCA